MVGCKNIKTRTQIAGRTKRNREIIQNRMIGETSSRGEKWWRRRETYQIK
jgi:hypothetical protein